MARDTKTLKETGSTTARKRGKASKSHPKKPKGCPDAPSWLSPLARELWDEHAAEIYELGALGILDRIAMGQLFTAMAEHQHHCEVLLSEGEVVEREHYCGPSPHLKARDDAAKRIATLLRYCGLTRTSRVTLTLDAPPAEAEEKPTQKGNNIHVLSGFAT